ncbi:PucR family transcriptional regulator [Rhodococcus jostii]|uniref:PucR C-terminal helix-turn-helix domain-containing protein n=1 Tax=Rhodococcus jostii TaxID=132919 RepID=A0A1H5E424_RHOJO|nr:helix-turn-helix domain-containing protein [Rhodococcus jostii]SED85680.1 PucR C-terminal helix-turn-helix domain-containing protein [Rhodococcus jostii]
MPESVGGDTIQRLCRQVSDEIESVTDRAVHQIRTELQSYAAVPIDEQRGYISRQLTATLQAVSENEPFAEDVLERSRQLGRRRAMQGLPLSDVIETYHIASRELWNTMVSRAEEPTSELLHAGGVMWDLVHTATSAVAVGHTDATRSEQAIRAGVRYRFFEALARDADGDHRDARALAEALGFDPQLEFHAVCLTAEEWSEAQLERLQRTLDTIPGTTQCSRHGTVIIALSQRAPVDHIVREIQRDHPGTTVGVGLDRPGLTGAAMSITDARRVLQLASPSGEVVRFADEWVAATLSDHRAELTTLLEPGVAVASEHPHLVEAVSAFARNGFSISAAGRDIHLHANSITYRLDRWQQLTGWDPRTLDGLQRSILSLELFHRDSRSAGSPPRGDQPPSPLDTSPPFVSPTGARHHGSQAPEE